MVTTRAMTRSQLAHATNEEGSTDFQEPVYIGDYESPEDVETFAQAAAVEEEKLPDDDAVLWTEYVSSGDIDPPPVVLHDVKLPSVLISCGVPSVRVCRVWSVSVSSATSSVPQVINVSTDYDNSSSAAINSIMSASTTVTRHSSISSASVHLINNDHRQELVDGYLQYFRAYTHLDRTTVEAMLLEDALNAASRSHSLVTIGD